MKSLLILSFLIIVTTFSNTPEVQAQTEKGNFLLGGSIGFDRTTNKSPSFEDTKSSTINFNPDISYFIIDRLSIGLTVPFGYSRFTEPSGASTRTQFSVGPMVRYYFPIGDFAIFPLASYTYGQSVNNGPRFDPSAGQIVDLRVKNNLTNFKVGAGLTYFLNSNVGIEGLLVYNKLSLDFENESFSDSDISSIEFNVGIQVYFSR